MECHAPPTIDQRALRSGRACACVGVAVHICRQCAAASRLGLSYMHLHLKAQRTNALHHAFYRRRASHGARHARHDKLEDGDRNTGAPLTELPQ